MPWEIMMCSPKTSTLRRSLSDVNGRSPQATA